ncbi:MAG: hypothetical protein QXY45_02730 [Candidatus Aenigmatarchaeota archaeon]
MVSIRTIVIINIILIFLALVYYLKFEITGFIDKAASVLLKIVTVEVDLQIYNPRIHYCKNETATTYYIVENTGLYDAVGNLSIFISNPSGNIIFSDQWNNIELRVGESKSFQSTIQFTDENSTGYYPIQGFFGFMDLENLTRWDNETSFIRLNEGPGILTASPPQIERTIKRGDSVLENIYVWLRYSCESGVVIITKSDDQVGNWTKISRQSLLVSSNNINSTTLNITIPEDTPVGNYFGYVYLRMEDQQINIPVIIHVIRRDFELKVRVISQEKTVCLGDPATAIINVTKSNLPGELLMNMTYQAIDSNSLIVDNKTEQILISDSIEKTSVLNIPFTASAGLYTFLATVQYEEITEQSYDFFEVIDCRPKPEIGGGGGGGAPLSVRPPLNYSMEIEVSTNIIPTIPGKEEIFTVKVKNTGNLDLKSVKLSIDGLPSTWVTVIPNDVDIIHSMSQEYLVILKIPPNAVPGKYEMKIKAVGKIESETKKVVVIIGNSLDDLADRMLEEMEKRRSVAMRVKKLQKCLDISDLMINFDEAEKAREMGLSDYKSKNYEKSVRWFQIAINNYEKMINIADLKIEVKIDYLSNDKIGIFPIFGIKKQLDVLKANYLVRNYENLCEPIINSNKLKIVSFVSWLLIISIIISLLIIIILYLKKRRMLKRAEILEKVKERIEKIEISGSKEENI